MSDHWTAGIDRRRWLQAAALSAWGAGSLTSSAQNPAWPSRPLRLIVPFTPGGTTDAVSRLVATEMSRTLGQTVVVDNKPGGGTVIGVDAGAKAAPDGHTLVCVANSFTVNHTLVRKLPYESFRDLAPVALMGFSEHVLAVHPGLKARNLKELIELSSRDKLSFGSFGTGSSAHLGGEMLRSMAGVAAVHIPYKGQAPALNDLLGGQISMMFGNWPEFAAQVRAGKLVAIGMATRQRSVFAPDIATLAEQGAPIESNSWNGLLVPAATPAALVSRLNAAVNDALAMPAVRQVFQAGGIVAMPGTPAQFASFMQSETVKYARIISEAGIVADP